MIASFFRTISGMLLEAYFSYRHWRGQKRQDKRPLQKVKKSPHLEGKGDLMQITKSTQSVCPVCFEEIPATILVDNYSVRMVKQCPEHGDFTGLVEKDPIFYMMTEKMGCNQVSYPGLFIDVTARCSEQCRICYYDVDNSKPDKPLKEIVDYARMMKMFSPFFLIGAEPTERQDLSDLLLDLKKIGDTCVVTNGLRFVEMDYVAELEPFLARGEIYHAVISLRPDDPRQFDKQLKAIGNIVHKGYRVASVLLTISDLSQMPLYLKIIRKFGPLVAEWRIRTATALWNTEKIEGEKLYVSDLLKFIQEDAKSSGINYQIYQIPSYSHSSMFFPIKYGDAVVILISWPDKSSVDLAQLRGPPFMLDKSGEHVNFAVALINNGKGRPLDQAKGNDTEKMNDNLAAGGYNRKIGGHHV
jgi:hypothetical protein